MFSIEPLDHLVDRQVDMVCAAVVPSGAHTGEPADRAREAGEVQALTPPVVERRVRQARDRQDPAQRSSDEVARPPARAWAGASERCDGHLHQTWVHLQQIAVVDADRRQSVSGFGLDDQIGARCQTSVLVATGGRIEVDVDAALAAVVPPVGDAAELVCCGVGHRHAPADVPRRSEPPPHRPLPWPSSFVAKRPRSFVMSRTRRPSSAPPMGR